jgi:Fe-S-cluster containining protein
VAETSFELRVRGKTISATVKLPDEPIRPVDLLPILQGFSNAIVGAAVPDDAKVSCQAGCGACCRQLVPISEIEALHLASLINEMPAERKAAVVSRFETLLNRLKEAGLIERMNRLALVDAATREKIGTDYFHLGEACPFLENESCSIHEHRPLSCREYLVTSPAIHCSAPTAATVKMVSMPVRLSYVLLQFSDGKGAAPVHVVPLPYLLYFASQHRPEEQPLIPAQQLFENFFNRMLRVAQGENRESHVAYR